MLTKKLLMVLGPTEIEEDILELGSHSQVYNRTPEFTEVLKGIHENLQYVFQTKNPVFILGNSGTGAMEAAVTNLLSAGDKVLVVNGGTFGARWTEICQKHKVIVEEIKLVSGEVVDSQEIKNRLDADNSIKVVFTTLNETSTGALTDVKEIGEIVKNYDTLLVVDAVSALVVEKMEMDNYHCDVVLTSSQKALALPPGLAFISFSDKAWPFVEKADLKTFYFDAFDYLNNWKRNQTPFTPPISLLIQLEARLNKIREEGLENIQIRYKKLTNMLRFGLKALDLKQAGENLANCVTGINSPENIDASQVVEIMSNKHNISIAPSPGDLKTKLFRIGNFGNIQQEDILTMLKALGSTLVELGHNINANAGYNAALGFRNNFTDGEEVLSGK